MFGTLGIKRTLTTLLTAALLTCGLNSAHALTLEYTGPTFTDFLGVSNPSDGSERVTATLHLDPGITSLSNGLNITDTDIQSFSLMALGHTIDSGNALASFFDLLIGPSLLPELWAFGGLADLGLGSPLPLAEAIVSIAFLGDAFLVDVDLNTQDIFSAQGGAFVDAFQSSPGIWTVQQPSTPDHGNNTVPEPSTMILLGSGLIALAGYRMKKKV